MMELGNKKPRSAKKRAGRKIAPQKTPRISVKTYETFFKHLPVGAFRTTPEGRIIAANAALAKMLGYEKASELWNVDVHDFYVDKKVRLQNIDLLAKQGATMTTFQLRRKDGRKIWALDFSRAVAGPAGRILFTDGIIRDISAEKRTEERLRRTLLKLAEVNTAHAEMIKKLERISLTDDLTGLYNRRGFNVLARQHLLLADRHKTLTFLLYIDLDDLKGINDTFGHHLGDDALVALAEILKATFRISDIKARMSGDEFAVFPIDTSIEGVETAKGRLDKALADFNTSGRKPFKLGVSTGVACYDPANPSTVEDILNRADHLMYDEKRRKNGRRPA